MPKGYYYKLPKIKNTSKNIYNFKSSINTLSLTNVKMIMLKLWGYCKRIGIVC